MKDNGGWNYRIVEKVLAGVVVLQIYEVYYNVAGEIETWTQDPVAPYGEDDWSSLHADMMLMVEAFNKPVLKYDELPS